MLHINLQVVADRRVVPRRNLPGDRLQPRANDVEQLGHRVEHDRPLNELPELPLNLGLDLRGLSLEFPDLGQLLPPRPLPVRRLRPDIVPHPGDDEIERISPLLARTPPPHVLRHGPPVHPEKPSHLILRPRHKSPPRKRLPARRLPSRIFRRRRHSGPPSPRRSLPRPAPGLGGSPDRPSPPALWW